MMALSPLEMMVDRALAGDPLSLSRLARFLDDGEPSEAVPVLARLYPLGGKAHIIGFTGPPGAGKSTLVNALIRFLRAEGKRVAVLAVDPTSPLSGGAVLGDRIRMQEHSTDPGVFIRSLATRGHFGGLTRSVGSLVTLLDAASFDVILLETVGVGQEEVEVKDRAPTRVVVTVPGLGDGIQAIKAGVLEIADIYLVNKADHPEAETTVRDLTAMLGMAEEGRAWTPPVLTAVAREGIGVPRLLHAIEDHRRYLADSGALEEWKRQAARQALEEALREEMESRLRVLVGKDRAMFEAEVDRIFRRETDPYSAARKWTGG